MFGVGRGRLDASGCFSTAAGREIIRGGRGSSGCPTFIGRPGGGPGGRVGGRPGGAPGGAPGGGPGGSIPDGGIPGGGPGGIPGGGPGGIPAKER